MKRRPHAELVLVVSKKFNFFRIHGQDEWRRAVRVHRKNLFAVVFLTMDKGQEKAARLRTEHVLQDASFQVPLQHAVVPHGFLAIPEQTAVTTTGGCAASLLELIVSGIGKTEHGLTESLAELVALGQQFETGALHGQRRVENHIAVANENRTRYFALHGCGKTDRTRAQMERGCVTLEIKIVDGDRLPAETQVAQLLVGGIGVMGGRGFGRQDHHRRGPADQPKPERDPNQ